MKLRLVERTDGLVGKKYVLGQTDCFRIIYSYIKDLDPHIPDSFGNLTLDGYVTLYKHSPKAAKKLMVKFIETYLDEIKVGFTLAGDVLLLEYRRADPFLGVNVGNGKVLSSSPELGVSILPRHYYKVLRAFRCHKQSQ